MKKNSYVQDVKKKMNKKKEKKRHNTNEHWVICVLTFFD